MSGVFISYRRDDSSGHAGRLLDHLSRTFGADEVFMDVDDIHRGESFADTLTAQLKKSDVLLAVIGRRWLTLTDAAGNRRLDNTDDWVRNEVSAAMSAGHLVIPVLVGGAGLPGAADLPADIGGLAQRQVAEVRDTSWNDDVARLCRDIKLRRARGSWREKLRDHRVSVAVTLSLVLAAGGYSAYTYIRSSRAGVPRAIGLTLGRATQSITDAGLRVGVVSTRATNEYPPDWVLDQNPVAPSSIRRGAAVSLVVAAPKAVDLTRYISVRDVGQEGTVAAAACVTAMDASLSAQGRPMRLSMRYVYEKAKRHDEIAGEGTFLETMAYVAQQFGAPPEALWPYIPLHRSLPNRLTWADLDGAAASYKARFTQLPDIGGVLGALDKASPVLAVALLSDAWGSAPAATTGHVTPPGASDPSRAQTAITIVGYDPVARRFKFANNWGAGWGDEGFGYFDAGDATAILQLDKGLWAVVVPAER